jgi:hypothetical protein
MLLKGIINIDGMSLSATINIEPLKRRRKGVSFCPHIGKNGKWRAFHNVSGHTRHLGYYDTEEKALEAARLKRKLTTTPNPNRDGVYPIKRAVGTMWRASIVPPVGRRLMLGEYATRGAAILVRDVVARRSGQTPTVVDYEMPLAFISNPIARSFIRDIVPTVTDADRIEYERRVMELSGHAGIVVEPPKPLALPDELWRTQQPSRAGRSPFDTLED